MASEFELIRRYLTRPAKSAVLGVGDDCALWRPTPGLLQAVSTDMLVEGRHFVAGTDPGKLGRKSLAVNLSDLAAMGAVPRQALLAIALPDANEAWLEVFASGFFQLAERHGVDLIGGDTTRGPLTISVTIIGEVREEHALRRDGARVGDDVWLSGATGEAALALAYQAGQVLLATGDLYACLARLDDPEPRLELGQRLCGVARAAIDISDGLLADLGHIAECSGVRINVSAERLPVAPALGRCVDPQRMWECIAAGGDDYELAFTAPQSARVRIQEIGDMLELPLTMIGEVVAGEPTVNLYDANGSPVNLTRSGFDHFKA